MQSRLGVEIIMASKKAAALIVRQALGYAYGFTPPLSSIVVGDIADDFSYIQFWIGEVGYSYRAHDFDGCGSAACLIVYRPALPALEIILESVPYKPSIRDGNHFKRDFGQFAR